MGSAIDVSGVLYVRHPSNKPIYAKRRKCYMPNSCMQYIDQCSLFSGIIVAPGAAGGNIVGSLFVKKLQMDCNRCARGMFIMSLLVMSLFSVFFIQCDNAQFYGVNVPNTSL